MKLPRTEKLKEELYTMGMLYGLVVAMVALAFFLSGPAAEILSFNSSSAAPSVPLGHPAP